jgi:hypothetical protein
MSRKPRRHRPGVLQLISARFVDRDWYLTSDSERAHYLTLFGRAMEHSDWRCIAYCLMSNQLSFAMIAGAQPLESWAKRVNSPFAQWLNRHRGRLGPIFAQRPRTIDVPPWRALDVIAFIHNDPVRSKIVAEAGAISWSSHRAYIGRVPTPNWLHVSEGLELAGFAEGPNQFDDAVRLLRERAHPFLEMRHGYVDEATSVDESPISRKSGMTAEEVLHVVAEVFAIPAPTLLQQRVGGEASVAKQIAVHAARAVGIPLATMALAMRVSRQRASRVASTRLQARERELLAEVVERLRKT